MKGLTLILAPDCHECEEVLTYIDQHQLPLEIKRLTMEELEDSELFIFPALKNANDVIAYGGDIINYLKNNSN